jgi:hypothetical protein
MCMYCMVGDHMWKHNPPWTQPQTPNPQQPWHPLLPLPVNPALPHPPWDLDRLKEFRDILKEIKELEDKLGCPCEPNKADYLDLLKKRIEALEERAK